MKSLAGKVFRATDARWFFLPLAVTILCFMLVGNAPAGSGYHRFGGYSHPRAYISAYVPLGSYWRWGPDAYWGLCRYRPHRVYKKIYRIYQPRGRW